MGNELAGVLRVLFENIQDNRTKVSDAVKVVEAIMNVSGADTTNVDPDEVHAIPAPLLNMIKALARVAVPALHVAPPVGVAVDLFVLLLSKSKPMTPADEQRWFDRASAPGH